MDPRDLLRAFPDGMPCTVCDEPVPAERIRLLARREEMAFVQVECAACGSTTLGFVADPASSMDPRPDRADPVSSDDVIEMHKLLDGWAGDLRSLVDERETSTPPLERRAGNGR
jgi:hypothetical protein